MKKLKNQQRMRCNSACTLVAAVAFLLSVPQAEAAPAKRAYTAAVYILKKITITPTAPLSFGKVTLSAQVANATKIVVTPDNGVTYTGFLNVLGIIGAGAVNATADLGARRGEVKLTGEPGAVYQLQAPTSVTLALGSTQAVADQFRFKSATAGTTGPNGYTAAFGSGGIDTVYLGGTLTFPAALISLIANLGNQLTISIPVTVQYQ